MWWLLRTMCFVHIVGNIVCLLEKTLLNPEAFMNISEVITYWGYPSEEYNIVTEDGYILLVNRIPHGRDDSSDLGQKTVVYLQHGWTLTAGIWVANPPKDSLAFLLADAGYDVWMGNSRGTIWARKHLHLDPDSKEFWAFTVDELIKYDLPSTIDFVLEKTGQKQVHYVGHSQGAMIGFGAFATNQQLAQKIKIYFALSPIATIRYVTSILRIFAYIEPTLIKVMFGEKDLFPTTPFTYIRQDICQYEPIRTICTTILSLVCGHNPKNLNESRIDVYMGQVPTETSVHSLLHYRQLILSGLFQAYDWGSPSLNIHHHNQPTPPLYKVENMKVPTAMWSGGRDRLADPIDVKKLEPKIANLIYHKKIPDHTHLDPVIGLDAREQIFDEIIAFINEDQSD